MLKVSGPSTDPCGTPLFITFFNNLLSYSTNLDSKTSQIVNIIGTHGTKNKEK